jgi:outer membrane protein TolC
VEVTDAQNRVARARDNNIAAVFNYESARLDLGAAIGKVREYIQ